MVALDHPILLDSQSEGFHRRTEVVFAGDRRVQPVRAGQEGDLAVAQPRQMVHRRMNTRGVVEENGGGLVSIEMKFSQNHGNVVVHQLVQDRLLLAEGEYGYPLHFALQHAADTVGQNDGVAIRGADQNLVPVGDRDLLKALDQLWEKGVGNVFNNDPEKTAAARDQGARVGVGKVIQLLDRLPDPLGQPVADHRRAVNGSGDGGDGNLRQGCDGADIGRLPDCLAGTFSNHEPFPFHAE